jgi:hypothetical protein
VAVAASALVLAGCGGSSSAGGGGHADPLLEVARCMRAHGVPHFPDPTTSPPVSPPGQGVTLGRGGVFLVIADPQAPAFKRAAAACHFGLPHPGG